MYFKQLEIMGFKSFPYKTKLKFESGITAVVGPNGCGKSNISDAIRWVLGEQSAKCLRGSSMEDVIFNGTSSAPPINIAEVSLTLSNEDRNLAIDYDEVTITRRLFRSGESEYILNKTPVRLKDITNLLMGTGIGTSSYSVIEQGRIGLILSTKPEDRRYIFEEASGITRYKAKKKEALKKLEHTENNLVRISDIINEVKRQINSIERHARKAEKYKKDFEAMKALDLKLTRYELERINCSFEENKGYLESASTKEKAIKIELDENAITLNKYREDLDTVILDMTSIQERLSESTLFIEKGKHTIELNKERISDSNLFKAESEEALRRLKERLASEEKEIDSIKKRFDSASKAKGEKESLSSQKEALIDVLSHEIEGHEKDIKSLKDRSLDLLAFQTKTKNELIKLGADIANRRTRLRRLETEKGNIKREEESAKALLAEADRESKAFNERVQKENHLLDGLKNSLVCCEGVLEKIRNARREKRDALKSLESKEEILKEMLEKFEGFDKGVKLVMDAAKGGVLPGIIGLLADIIEAEKGHESALEAALGSLAQAIVVENRDALGKALRFLEERKASAHFIIYEDIKEGPGREGHKAVMQDFGIPEFRSFVAMKPPYEGIADYLLNNIYFVESQGRTCEVYKALKEDVKFVTKNGLFIERGHVLGAFTADENVASIIGRAKKLRDMGIAKVGIRESIGVLEEEETREMKGACGLKREIASRENELKMAEIALANSLSKKESAEANFKKITDEAAIVELEIGEVNELVHEISFKDTELNTRLNEKEIEYTKGQEFISSSRGEAERKVKLKNSLIFEMSEIKSELAFLKNMEEQEAKNLDKENSLFVELKEQCEKKEKDIEGSERRSAMLENETRKLEEEINSKKSDEARLKENLSEISSTRHALTRDLRDKETMSRQKEEVLEDLRNQIRNLEIKEKESELTIVNITDRMRQAYKLDINEIAVPSAEDVDWEDIRNQIEVFRIKLEKLGTVNLVAIEEHKELEERHSFLTHQEEDLLRSKESLHKAILTINKTTKALFIETFQKIQAEFKNYFRMLFGGGHAELLLLDEGDVLEAGIEIVVRPPGKKLQNLLLLSGGEKALTAIALLFSIFKVKPSPFCILDEVDAPLDELNIGRFTAMLQDFLKTSQFIIITHSKRTMQMANVLYGITMEEKGISKIVSVKFADDEADTPAENEKVLV